MRLRRRQTYRLRCRRCGWECVSFKPAVKRGALYCSANRPGLGICRGELYEVAAAATPGKVGVHCDNCGKAAPPPERRPAAHYLVTHDKAGRALSANRCGAWVLALLLALAAWPARAEEWKPPTRVETGLLVAAELLIAADAAQTLAARWGGPTHRYEGNPLLGEHPSAGVILGASAVAMLGTGLGWYFLPTPWRDCLTVSVVFVEVPNVTRGALLAAGVRF